MSPITISEVTFSSSEYKVPSSNWDTVVLATGAVLLSEDKIESFSVDVLWVSLFELFTSSFLGLSVSFKVNVFGDVSVFFLVFWIVV